LRDLEGGVHGVVAAIVEEISNVVRPEHLNEPLVFGPVLFQALELEAGGAKGAGRGVLQALQDGRGLPVDVDQILGQRPDDAVPSGIEFPDVAGVLFRSLDDAGRRGIDDGGHTT